MKIPVPQKKVFEFKIFGFIPIFSKTTTKIIEFDYKEISEKVAIDLEIALEKRLKP